jgi:hypothetical protein
METTYEVIEMSCDSLAHHLETAAVYYRALAGRAQSGADFYPEATMPAQYADAGRIAQQFERQACECELWFSALNSYQRITADSNRVAVMVLHEQ